MFMFTMGIIMHIEVVGEERANGDFEGHVGNDDNNYIGYKIIGMYVSIKGCHLLVVIEVV